MNQPPPFLSLHPLSNPHILIPTFLSIFHASMLITFTFHAHTSLYPHLYSPSCPHFLFRNLLLATQPSNLMHMCPHPRRISLSLSLYFPLLLASKPRPYRHRLKRIRHGSGAVKKPIHVSASPIAKSSKFHRCFRRIRMKRSLGGGRLRSVAVQAVVVHCSTRRRGQSACSTRWRGGAERRQLGPASRAPDNPLISSSSVIVA